MRGLSLSAGTIALVLAVVATTAPARATVFPAMGGTGDRAEEYRCPSGNVLVGFIGRTGSWVDQIGLMCAPLLLGNTTGSVTTLPPRGGNGGSPTQQYCEPGAAIRAITAGIYGGWRYTAGIAFSCVRLKDGSPAGGGMFVGVSSGEVVATAKWRPDLNQACPGSEYATGLNIRYGKHVNAVGLICGPVEPQRIVVIIPPNLGGAPPAQPAPAQPGQLMTGTFDTNLGKLVFNGIGGTYGTLDGRVTITGIAGSTMNGIWSTSWSARRCPDGGFHGTFRFDFTPGGFTGAYGYCSDPPTAAVWNGRRL